MEDNWAHSQNRGPNGGACDGILRDWTIQYPILPELLIQVFQARTGVPGTPQTLTNEKDIGVGAQKLCVTLANRLGVC
jgi:hypothetical protein